MQSLAAIAGSVLIVLSAIPYIVSILKGKAHPNLVTWVTWTLLAGVQTAADLSAGADRTALLSAGATLGNGLILLLALSRGVKKYSAFDVMCQALALAGFVLWRLTGNPNTAVALSSAVILVAALPTWRHAYLSPYAEIWINFALGGLAGLLTILSLTSYTFAGLALPGITLINAFVMTTVINLRRRQIPLAS